AQSTRLPEGGAISQCGGSAQRSAQKDAEAIEEVTVGYPPPASLQVRDSLSLATATALRTPGAGFGPLRSRSARRRAATRSSRRRGSSARSASRSITRSKKSTANRRRKMTSMSDQPARRAAVPSQHLRA